MELHAPKGQRVLFDVTCTKRSGIEEKKIEDRQPKKLWIRSYPDIARWVEEHEKQQAAAIAAWPQPLRPVGRPRSENASEPSNKGRGRAEEGGEVLSLWRCSRVEEVTSEGDTGKYE